MSEQSSGNENETSREEEGSLAVIIPAVIIPLQ